jgi:hypothetical protein
VPSYRFKPEIVLEEKSAAIMWKKTTSLFTKKKGSSSSSKPSSMMSSRRHSVSEFPQSMEEDTTPPRRNDTLLLGGMRAPRSTSMRFTEPQGHTEKPPVPPRRSTRSSAPPPYTPRYSTYGFIIFLEDEKKLSRLEKRLVGFGTNIYYMLEHLGWVQFSNGVSAKTHKVFALEILMTMVPILDEGVPSLSFCLEGIQRVVPYEQIRELLRFQKGASEKVDVSDAMLGGFGI